MGEFSISHILIMAIILLIFFGPSRLPALGQSLGKAIKGFKDAMNDAEKDAHTTFKTNTTESTQVTSLKSNSETISTQDKDKQHQNNS